MLQRSLKIITQGEVEIFIFGDGPDRTKLIDICREMQIDNIHFMGQVNKKFI